MSSLRHGGRRREGAAIGSFQRSTCRLAVCMWGHGMHTRVSGCCGILRMWCPSQLSHCWDVGPCHCVCVSALLQVSEEHSTPGAYMVSVTLPKLQTCVTEFEADPDTDLFQVRWVGVGVVLFGVRDVVVRCDACSVHTNTLSLPPSHLTPPCPHHTSLPYPITPHSPTPITPHSLPHITRLADLLTSASTTLSWRRR